MKVVIDTNILISAVLKDRMPETVILFVLENADYQWIVSPEILTEYGEVLGRKRLKIPIEIQKQWLQLIENLTTTVIVSQPLDFPRDPKDAKFLACAVASDADFLITGDKDFEDAKRLVNTTILSLSAFKRLVCDTQP
ncbi:MAG: putative toxin-antitoxin system toxin component, PIN family [Cyanobacteria bacterium J06649_4]